MESRVYAEDPLRGFLPSTGPLLTYKEPTHLFKDLEVSALLLALLHYFIRISFLELNPSAPRAACP